MTKFNKIIFPLLVILIPLVIAFSPPFPLSQEMTALSENDIKLSSANASLPDIAVSDFYVAAVYVQSGKVYLKSATSASGWGDRTLLGNGTMPHVLFKVKEPNTVHVIWLDDGSKRVQYTTCVFKSNEPPTCGNIQTIRYSPGVTAPDMAMDKIGNLVVVWIEDNIIEVAKLPNGSSSWEQPIAVAGNFSNPNKPVLATSNNYLHLAFENEQGTAIAYYRSVDGGNNWTNNITYKALSATFPLHDKLGNPTIKAVGTTVYLAWDAHYSPYKDYESGDTIDNAYGLAWVSSTDEGINWSKPTTILSDQPTETETVADKRLSQAVTTNQIPSPSEEMGLRPSMTISGSTFAIVWQQRPNAHCTATKSGTAQIYYAYNPTNWINNVLGQSDSTYYNIAPKIAIGQDGKAHVLFMRANPTSFSECEQGANKGDYAIYYRGEFIKSANPPDNQGEKTTPSLSISKAGPVTSTVNSEIIYTLIVANNGNASANDVVIMDTVPTNTTYQSGGTFDGEVVKWDTIKELAAGMSKEVSFKVKAPSKAMLIVNENYEVTASGGYRVVGNTAVTTEIIATSSVGKPSLSILKAGPVKAEVGSAITYTLTVVNSGDAPATGLVISDVIPTGATYLSGGTLVDNVVSWSVDSLAKGNGIVTKTFFVATKKTITNSNYGVSALGGYGDVGKAEIVTVVNEGGGEYKPNDPPDDSTKVYLPIILK